MLSDVELSKLHNVGQFFLGARVPAAFGEWPRTSITGDCHVWAHPELPVTQIGNGERSLTLIGIMLDPIRPGDDDAGILQRLADTYTDRASLLNATRTLGGRWIVIARSPSEQFLFHDALGLRQVCYTDRAGSDGVYAMSQSGMAQEFLGLKVEPGARGYIDSYLFRSNPEYRFPGAATPFQEINQLLPNHLIDLRTGECIRYWPNREIEASSIDRATEESSGLLSGMITAATRRFDVVLSVTAGLDSRLVLASSRNVRNSLHYMTLRQARMPDKHADISIPRRLLPSLGLRHEVVEADGTTSPSFSFVFKKNVFLAHDHYAADAEALLTRYGRKLVVITGSGGEVGRGYTRLANDHREDFVSAVMKLELGGTHPFARAHYGQWWSGLGNTYNVSPSDLFEWEQGHGRWLATTQLQFDIAWRDTITPFNCRGVLESMLGVDEKLRNAPKYVLFYKLISRQWPETLNEPVNPHRRTSWWRRLFIRGLDYSYRRLRSWSQGSV